MSSRSSAARRNCKLLRAFVCLSGILFWLGYLTPITLAEPVMILDPVFYRTPVFLPIAGSSRTVIGFYDQASDGAVTPISKDTLGEHPLPELRSLALAHARALLKQVAPKITRDKRGVAIDVRIESTDPSLSSLVLIPGFTDQFAHVLGKNCIVAIPNRQVIFLFPRIGEDLDQLAEALRSFYHNNAWPVSTELFESRNGDLVATRDLEPNH
jgi:hypothetical protein